VIVDDAQWLDRESADVLAFVARRLEADRIVLLFSVREDRERRVPLEGIPELYLGGLPQKEALELLRSVAEERLDDRVGAHILEAAGGNPLALVEFAGGLTPAQLSGGSLLPDPLPLGSALEERFVSQVRALPAETQTLLLLAATEPSGEPAVFWRAADNLGLGVEAAAGTDRLLVHSPRLVFRHPLIRSAVYAAAEAAERRRVHAALAAASDPEHDPDRRAWHRGMAAVRDDEEAARDLEASAGRARERGGFSAAAAFLERAAELSADEGRRTARLLAACEAELTAGAPGRAQALLSQVTPKVDDRFQRAQALRLQGAIGYALGRLAPTPAILGRAAETFEPVDLGLALTTHLEALQAAVYAGRLVSSGSLSAVARAALAASGDAHSEETVAAALLEGFATRVIDGNGAAAPTLRRAIDLLRGEELPSEERLRWLMLGCIAAGELLDDDAEHVLANRWVLLARKEGALTALPVALNYLGWYEVQAGRLAAAESHLLERREIAAATGNPGVVGLAGAGDLLLVAWRGREEEARAAAEEMRRDCTERGQGAGVTHAQSALALLELGLGRYQEALVCALDVYEEDLPYLGTLTLPDLIEAAARSGDVGSAELGLERLSDRVRASGTLRARGLLARSRALVADDGKTEALYKEAIEDLQGPLVAPELARAHLLYGEWLRRQRRRLEAREELRRAYEMLDAIGAEGFAERARLELLATGGRARRRTSASADELTPQEARIARLASEGFSNPEIAPSCSSARARSTTTCARFSESWASARARSSISRCRLGPHQTSVRSCPRSDYCTCFPPLWGGGTISTGRPACSATSCERLPFNSSPAPVRPLEPITIAAAPISSATSTTPSQVGAATSTRASAVKPALRATSAPARACGIASSRLSSSKSGVMVPRAARPSGPVRGGATSRTTARRAPRRAAAASIACRAPSESS
jgi:hypothetical protein